MHFSISSQRKSLFSLPKQQRIFIFWTGWPPPLLNLKSQSQPSIHTFKSITSVHSLSYFFIFWFIFSHSHCPCGLHNRLVHSCSARNSRIFFWHIEFSAPLSLSFIHSLFFFLEKFFSLFSELTSIVKVHFQLHYWLPSCFSGPKMAEIIFPVFHSVSEV